MGGMERRGGERGDVVFIERDQPFTSFYFFNLSNFGWQPI